MSATDSHRWRLVAPWYRWDLRAHPDPARADAARRPVVQKFARVSFVTDFVRDPQGSLAYTDEDTVQQLVAVPPLPVLTSGPNAGRARQLALSRAVPTETRKLFQPAHQRFYLVTVELHCDVAGFPRVDPANVEEVGFVIRRRVTGLPDARAREAAGRLAELAATRARAQHEAVLDAARQRARLLVPLRSPARLRVVQPRAATLAAYREVATAKRRLQVWSVESGLSTEVQGWAPGAVGSIGAWVPVGEEPGEIVEQVYPMHRLPAPPGDPDHPAATSTIYFGLLPTTSPDAAEDGSPRFDDTGLYELRCYARRAGGECPALPVWSEASAPFALAGFHDPAGCANRPVNIRLPDFATLAATSARPSVRMSAPPGSHPMLTNTDLTNPAPAPPNAAEEICFFAIPLITIVAYFLLNLILPIVLIAFQLWWMLKLKFCIPPSVTLAGQVNAELSAIPGGLSAAAGIDIDVDLRISVAEQTALQNTLRTQLNDNAPGLGDALTAQLTNNAIVQALLAQGLASGGTQSYPATLPGEPRVTRDEVIHP